MSAVTSSFRFLKRYRTRRRQVRTALLMLSASGVIRPSHIEPRYFEQPAHIDTFHRQTARARPSSTNALASPSVWQRNITVDVRRIRNWIGAMSPARLQPGQ